MPAETKQQSDDNSSSDDTARDVLALESSSATVKAKRWMIRGVPAEVRDMATRAAKESGVTIGKLVTEAITAHLSAADDDMSQGRDPLEELDELALYMEERLSEIESRMKTVESEDRLIRLVQRPWIREVS